MPRPPRITVAGVPYHLLNRRVLRLELFQKPADYAAFERILNEGLARPDAPALLAWCLMPNHWHLVVRPKSATNLSAWMQWLSVTHTHRWHQHYHSAGHGPLYQGRFKSFPIQEDHRLLTVIRSVEANALRAGLAPTAEAWAWGSLRERTRPSADRRGMLAALPVDLPAGWVNMVNEQGKEAQVESIRQSIRRGTPFGEDSWADCKAKSMGLDMTQRPRGRPRKRSKVGKSGVFDAEQSS